MVRFAPCARTAWHSYAVGQTLHVTKGRGRIQSRGGEVIEIGPGDSVYTPLNIRGQPPGARPFEPGGALSRPA
jgi:quercetin dioxygenase-like cupin family protein